MSDADASARRGESLLVVTADGYGKRIGMRDLMRRQRGAKGYAVVAEPGTVPVVAALVVGRRDELLIATRRGQMMRLPAADVPVYRRRARGVRVVRLRDGDEIARVVRVPP